jgi:D-glycero-D-manno-heptose 1,7-bisphosphate phosphatase
MGIGRAMNCKAVFLDRDGVITRAIVRQGRPYPPKDLRELEILPGVAESLWALRLAGYDLIVVTNQPDVARGTMKRELVDAFNDRLKRELPLDEILTCFHDDAANCVCRKPKPGFMHMMERDRGIDLANSFLVGDRWRDIEAGCAAGCRTIFLDYHYDEPRPLEQADHVCSTLAEAALWIQTASS